MRRAILTMVIVLGWIASSGTPAAANGWGGYLEYSGYSGSISGNAAGRIDADARGQRIGLGMAMDTNPLGEGLFNYRLDAGWVHSWEKLEQDGRSFDYNSNGFSVNNAFGFRVYGNATTRLWVGPAIGAGVDNPDNDDLDVTVTLGGGPQIGLDLAAGDGYIVALTTGYQYRYRRQSVADPFGGNIGIDGGENYWLFNVALLYDVRD